MPAIPPKACTAPPRRGLTPQLKPVVIGLAGSWTWGRVMDPRYILSALAGIFCFVLVLAIVTTVRHVSHRGDLVAARPG